MPLATLALGRAADFEAGMTIVKMEADAERGMPGLAVPLIRDGRLRALLHIASEGPRSWLPEEVALVEDCGDPHLGRTRTGAGDRDPATQPGTASLSSRAGRSPA